MVYRNTGSRKDSVFCCAREFGHPRYSQKIPAVFRSESESECDRTCLGIAVPVEPPGIENSTSDWDFLEIIFLFYKKFLHLQKKGEIMKDTTRTAALAVSRNIADHFYEGNDVSKRMGRILAILTAVLEKSDARFDRMRGELQSVYEEMSRVHNKLYQDLGGRMGSGEFFSVDVENIESKTDVKFKQLVDGINPEAFMQLQLSLGGLRELIGKLTADTPFRTPDAIFAERLQFTHWVTFMSIYESKHRDRVLKILAKYDPKAS